MRRSSTDPLAAGEQALREFAAVPKGKEQARAEAHSYALAQLQSTYPGEILELRSWHERRWQVRDHGGR